MWVGEEMLNSPKIICAVITETTVDTENEAVVSTQSTGRQVKVTPNNNPSRGSTWLQNVAHARFISSVSVRFFIYAIAREVTITCVYAPLTDIKKNSVLCVHVSLSYNSPYYLR
eukprot:TRINITY_DN3900_c0_g1_i10.p2 TRINITY_DN3900_c0_g1~~TRINITY_DN3900_c0_g1_i10.p2  ORF type:complete len:114 (+),score=8.12 TRINITY_DN3900_c0_g1_i10:487-828(+)